MGEIGITRNTFLYDLCFWETRCIIRGYNRRHRDIWSSMRWQTYHLMCAQVGGDKLSEKGINGVHDLLPLPWDEPHAGLPTPEEVDDMVAEINAINAANSKPKA